MIMLLLQTFELMEKKVLEARSGRCEVRSAEHNGRMIWARGGKVRIELKMKDVEVKIVSDGRRWSVTHAGETRGPHDLEPGFADCLLATLTRPGVVAALMLTLLGNEGPPAETFKVTELKPGDPIDYSVSTPNPGGPLKVKLWLKDGLPMKRELRIGEHVVTETYAVELDVPLKDVDFTP